MLHGGGTPPHHDPVGFGGQFGYYTDTETGLLCLTHRYYDPGTGKFINRDPIGYQGGENLYGFADGNPVNESDPSGFAGGEDDEESDDIFGQRLFQEIVEAQKEAEANARAARLSVDYEMAARSVSMQDINDFLERDQERNFYNVFGEDPPYEVQPSMLGYRNGKFVEITPKGAVRSAQGKYIFIVQNNQIFIKRASFNMSQAGRDVSHIDLARGESVQYAGEIQFAGTTARGVMRSWSNRSGHYLPAATKAYRAGRAGLPLNKFVPERPKP